MTKGPATPRLKRVRAANRLTATKVERLKEPGFFEDGNGLRLVVTKDGRKRWVLRLIVNGGRTNRGLGVWPDVTLEQARRQAEQLRGAAKEGRDMRAEERAKAQRAKAASVTFRAAFEIYFAGKSKELRNDKDSPNNS